MKEGDGELVSLRMVKTGDEVFGTRCFFVVLGVEYMTSSSEPDENSSELMNSAASLLAMSSMGSPYGSEIKFMD